MAKYPLLIKIANLLVYVFLLGANVYSAFGPAPSPDDTDPGTPDNPDNITIFDEESSSPYRNHQTFISPAPFVFGIWGLIHFLLGGFVIYQFFGAHDLIVDGINWHFVGITLFNTLWLTLWQTDHAILSWFAILFTAGQISYVYSCLKKHREDDTCTLSERIWVHMPFSLYHAWIVVIAVISTFAAFTQEKNAENVDPTVITQILVVIGISFLEGTAVGYVSKLKGDITGAIVIAWSLYGITVEQDNPVIHWSSLIFAVITSLHILVSFVKRFTGSREESAPLLG